MNENSPSEKAQEQAYNIEQITPRRHKLLNNKLANKLFFFYLGGLEMILDFLK